MDPHRDIFRNIQPETKADMTLAEFNIITALDMLMQMTFNLSKERGWYNDPETGEPLERNFGESVALVHSELSEALEAHRTDAMDDKLPHRNGIEVELADAVMRICDLARRHNLDLPGAIIEKYRFNRTRPDHDTQNRRKAGGKKY
jgi:NTP pyrophosphatase (non-canonical NTP hydrolase)